MRGNIYFCAPSLRLYIGSEEILLPLEQDTKAAEKSLVEDEDIRTTSEDFTSDSNARADSSDSLEN